MGLRVDERYVVLDKLYNGTEKAPNPGNKETHLVTQFTGFYTVNPDLTILGVVPYVRRTTKEWDAAEMTFNKGNSSGLGDISLFGRYAFFSRHDLDSTTIVAGLAGVKLPTGATNARNDMGVYMDSHIQPGTGSTDALLGLNISHSVDRFTLAANALYGVRNEGAAGDTKHQFGNGVNYDVTGLYRLYPATPPGPTTSIAFGVAGEQRDREKLNGVTMSGSEGHVIYLNTGLLVMPFPRWIMEFNYRPAIYHNLPATTNGAPQLGEDYKVTLSLTTFFR
jgi:hypothetical protein